MSTDEPEANQPEPAQPGAQQSEEGQSEEGQSEEGQLEEGQAKEGQPEGDQAAGDEPGEAVVAGGGEPPELTAAAEPNPVRDRLVLPLVLPILAIVAVALLVLNLSRVFLAGGSGAGSVVIAAIVTVAILTGAAVLSAMPQLRSSTLTMTVTLLIVIVMGAGMISLGPSEPHGEGGEGGYHEPEGDPNSELAVDALPSLSFQSDEFTVPGGILQLDYIGKGGNHTLVFEEQEFRGFELAVSGDETDQGKVEIAEGDYVIYCDVPGHRAAGMEADLVITPAPPGDEGQPAPGGGEEPPPTDAP
jgi:plastocyanin